MALMAVALDGTIIAVILKMLCLWRGRAFGEELFSIREMGVMLMMALILIKIIVERWHFARNRSYTGSESDNNDTQRGNHMIDTRDSYNCGKTGHLARNRPYMGSESDDKDNTGSDTRRGNYRSDTRECYNCGRTGHLARKCSFSECRSSDTDNNDSDTSEGDQLVMQAEILTGTVKWFNNEQGYGFITPDGGGEDLFVHQSSIKFEGYRSLAQGEVIEFQIERGDDGRKKAVDVTGPGGSFVQGTARREPYH